MVLGEAEGHREREFGVTGGCKRFAVGDVLENRLLGYGGVIMKYKERLEDMMKWCPDYAIALMNRLPDG